MFIKIYKKNAVIIFVITLKLIGLAKNMSFVTLYALR